MKFNSPLLRLSYMMLNNGELKSCSINSPLWGIENFRCNIGMSILHQGVKEIGKIPHLSLVASHSWLMGNLFFTTCGFATTWWKIQSLFLLGKGLGQSLIVSRDWIYSAQSLIYVGLGSISSWDWFLALQSLQMIGKFLFVVPYTKFSLTIRQWDIPHKFSY